MNISTEQLKLAGSILLAVVSMGFLGRELWAMSTAQVFVAEESQAAVTVSSTSAVRVNTQLDARLSAIAKEMEGLDSDSAKAEAALKQGGSESGK